MSVRGHKPTKRGNPPPTAEDFSDDAPTSIYDSGDHGSANSDDLRATKPDQPTDFRTTKPDKGQPTDFRTTKPDKGQPTTTKPDRGQPTDFRTTKPDKGQPTDFRATKPDRGQPKPSDLRATKVDRPNDKTLVDSSSPSDSWPTNDERGADSASTSHSDTASTRQRGQASDTASTSQRGQASDKVSTSQRGQASDKASTSQPIVAISMKTPADPRLEPVPKQEREMPHVKLRAMSEVARAQQPQNLGNLAPPYDPSEARKRTVRDVVVYGCLAVMLASVIALVIWFVAT